MMSISDDAKRAYVERTKAANYQASLRLEGFAERKIPRSKTLEEAVAKYRQLATVQQRRGG
jgi:hypothetical protein